VSTAESTNEGKASAGQPVAGKALITSILKQGRCRLSEHEAKRVLHAYGIPVTQEQVVHTSDELTAALQCFSWPVVLKVDSPDILHKTEAGLVVLGCQNLEEAQAAYIRIVQRAQSCRPEAKIDGVLVQEMIADATECIVGMRRDEQFGPTLMFGLGGIFVEVFQDVTLRVAPLTPEDAEQMVKGIRGYEILAGARGRAPANVDAIEDVLLKMSRLALDLDEYVAEIDVNPLMVGSSGRAAKAADALMLLSARRRDTVSVDN
jgi:acyl-CoA synthetase (NDP forming)